MRSSPSSHNDRTVVAKRSPRVSSRTPLYRLNDASLGAAGVRRIAVELSEAQNLAELECAAARACEARLLAAADAGDCVRVLRLDENDLANGGKDMSGLQALMTSVAKNKVLRSLRFAGTPPPPAAEIASACSLSAQVFSVACPSFAIALHAWRDLPDLLRAPP